jgi:bidirectional [NiFe] hydrogenase diaphorase subunit
MRLGDWARRRAHVRDAGNAITDLAAGFADDEVAERRGLRPAGVAGIRSFYELLDRGARVCDGTACRFAPGADALRARLAELEPGGIGVVRCLGHCYAAPALWSGRRVLVPPPGEDVQRWIEDWGADAEPHDDLAPIPCVALTPAPMILRHLVPGATRPASPPARPSASEYDLPEGGAILAAVDAAGLRGRGGAAFPTAAKWRAARETVAAERWVVANGDEGDPGAFIDRLLLEADPHAVLSGLVACARAVRARHAVVYVRAEYPRALETVRRAIAAAADGGLLGGVEVTAVAGAGAYVVGEETALLEAIEGRRGEPRVKPPYPAQSGLWGAPTVVQNVETLAAVSAIARTGRAARTKVLSVSGAVARPGAVEVDLGTPLRRALVEGAGGPRSGSRWTMALVGGPLGRVVPATDFDVAVDFNALPGLGHGGVVVLDERTSPRALAEHLFEFARAESCGSCAPCRLATRRLLEARDLPQLERLLDVLETGSRCGFGLGVPRPIRDLVAHFGRELFP